MQPGRNRTCNGRVLGEAFGGLTVGAFEDEDFDGDVGVEADLREECANLASGELLDGVDEAGFHGALEGEPCVADGVGFAGVEQGSFDGHKAVFEEADDVVVADNGADAFGAAAVVLALEFGDCVRDRLRALAVLGGGSSTWALAFSAPRRESTRKEVRSEDETRPGGRRERCIPTVAGLRGGKTGVKWRSIRRWRGSPFQRRSRGVQTAVRRQSARVAGIESRNRVGF